MESIIMIIWNIIVFATYGLDKYNAINGKRRISEKSLLAMAFFMGGVGAFLGMQVLRHKTRHLKFIICVPLAMLLNIAVIYFFGRVSV